MTDSPNLALAAKNMDWQQVVLNGGPPCFHLAGNRFCGRAERWNGHGDIHKFVSLADLLRAQSSGDWVMVPREATAEMVQAMEDRQIEGASYIAENSIQFALWKEVWKAAITAALSAAKERG